MSETMPMATAMVLPNQYLELLNKPFPDTHITTGQPRHDGFVPREIHWRHLWDRLNEVFGGGWSWVVQKVEVHSHVVLVIGRISVHMFSRSATGDQVEWRLERDGVGSAIPRVVNNFYMDIDYDIKAAETDAFKRAAMRLGLGIQLYGTEGRVDQAAVPPPNQPKMLPAEGYDPAKTQAQPFQVNIVIQRLEVELGIPRQTWMNALQISDFAQITALTATEIMQGNHWYLRQISQQTGRPIAGMALTSSNAR